MKYITMLTISLLSFFGDLLMQADNSGYRPSRGERLVSETLSKTKKIIKKKYPDIIFCGSGISMPGGPVRELGFAFDTRGPFTKEYLRKLLIEFALRIALSD